MRFPRHHPKSGAKGLELAASLPAHPPTLRDTPEDSLSGRLRTPGWRGRYFCRDKHGGGRVLDTTGGGQGNWVGLLGRGEPWRPHLYPNVVLTHASARFRQAEMDLGLHIFPGCAESQLESWGPGGWCSTPEGMWIEGEECPLPKAGWGRVTGPGSIPHSAPSILWTSCISHFLLEAWEG